MGTSSTDPLQKPIGCTKMILVTNEKKQDLQATEPIQKSFDCATKQLSLIAHILATFTLVAGKKLETIENSSDRAIKENENATKKIGLSNGRC